MIKALLVAPKDGIDLSRELDDQPAPEIVPVETVLDMPPADVARVIVDHVALTFTPVLPEEQMEEYRDLIDAAIREAERRGAAKGVEAAVEFARRQAAAWDADARTDKTGRCERYAIAARALARDLTTGAATLN